VVDSWLLALSTEEPAIRFHEWSVFRGKERLKDEPFPAGGSFDAVSRSGRYAKLAKIKYREMAS
jgi:hypothetical protein